MSLSDLLESEKSRVRCLVLGGAGFIGSHVVEGLIHRGHVVRLLDLRPNPHWSPPDEVKCIWADWNDADQLECALANIDVVIHLIGTTLPTTSNLDMVADVRGNLISTLRLLHACHQHGVRKIVFSSSGGTIYGIPQQIPIPEDHPTHPITSYGIVKLTIEHYLHLCHRLYGLGYIVLRSANPYGERQNPQGSQGAVSVFLGRLARSEPVEIWGDGRIVRDYFYVDDLARAFLAAVESEIDHGTFNVGSGQGLSLLELLSKIQSVTGLSPRIIHRPARPADVPINVLDTRRIRSHLNWQPQVALSDGLQRTWEWIRSIG